MSQDRVPDLDRTCVLVIRDDCNPYVGGREIMCESYNHALELFNRINMTFPVCPHGRAFSVKFYETPEEFEASIRDIDKQIGQHQHKRIMGFIENVKEGNLKAELDGEELDEFQLASLTEEQLQGVAFSVTEKGKQETIKRYREQGFTVIDLSQREDHQGERVDPRVDPRNEENPED